jgi:hypothetical protein
MPMKPTPPESLKGVAAGEPKRVRARILDDEEVEMLAAKGETEEDQEDEEEVTE